MNYTVADFIIRIKNAVMAGRKTASFPYAKLTKSLAMLLARHGYLRNVKEEEKDGKKVITVEIVYDKREAQFTDVIIISKPSLRVYATKIELAKKEKRGIGKLIVSTNSGVMTGMEALKKGLGGELLFEIW